MALPSSDSPFPSQFSHMASPPRTNNLFLYKCLLSYSLLLQNSMKRTLLLSPSLHRSLSHETKLLSSTSTGYPCAACIRFPSLSLPFSTIFPRPFHSLKVLAMAERPSTSSHAHKFTNRLAAEHSPYLLQHAHNPVSAIHLHIGLFIIVFLLCAQRVGKEKEF